MTKEEARDFLLDIAYCIGKSYMECYDDVEIKEIHDEMVEAVRVLYGSKEENE